MKNIIKKMRNTFQIEDKQTVLQHGLQVFKYTKDLVDVLNGKESRFNQKIPSWILDDKQFIKEHLVDYKTIKHYCIWHDMGKPFCKPDRQIKFLDHDKISFNLWNKTFPEKKQVGELILNDMKIHKVRSGNFEEFLNTPNLVTHLIVGLAEMNANSEMFGGKESDSYKIKYKNFDKFGKRALFKKMEIK